MEATGGYEQLAFQQLSEQGLPVAILNPRSVRQFAERSEGSALKIRPEERKIDNLRTGRIFMVLGGATRHE